MLIINLIYLKRLELFISIGTIYGMIAKLSKSF